MRALPRLQQQQYWRQYGNYNSNAKHQRCSGAYVTARCGCGVSVQRRCPVRVAVRVSTARRGAVGDDVGVMGGAYDAGWCGVDVVPRTMVSVRSVRCNARNTLGKLVVVSLVLGCLLATGWPDPLYGVQCVSAGGAAARRRAHGAMRVRCCGSTVSVHGGGVDKWAMSSMVSVSCRWRAGGRAVSCVDDGVDEIDKIINAAMPQWCKRYKDAAAMALQCCKRVSCNVAMMIDSNDDSNANGKRQ